MQKTEGQLKKPKSPNGESYLKSYVRKRLKEAGFSERVIDEIFSWCF